MTQDAVRGKLTRIFTSRIVGTSGWSAAAVAVSAVTGILTARGLGPESRGTLALVLSIAGLTVLVGAMGSNVAVRRHLPQKKGVTLRGYERLSIALLGPLAIILLAVMYVAAAVVDPSFGDIGVGFAFIAYGVGYFLSNQALDLLNATGQVVKSARTNAFGSFFCLLLVASVTFLGWGLVSVIYSYALSTLFQFAFAYWAVVKIGARQDPETLGMKILLREGSKLLGLNLGQNLAFRSDTILLGALAAPQEVGIYAVATTPAAILRIPTNAMGQLAFYQAASGDVSPRQLLLRLAKLLLVLLPFVAVGLIAADWLFVFIYGYDYAAAADSFRILLLAEMALAPFLVLGRTIAGLGSTWGASVAGISGVLVLVVLAVILIPPLGAIGAAWASVAAYGTMSSTAAIVFWNITRSGHRGTIVGV